MPQAHIRHFPALTTAFGRAAGRMGACSSSAHCCITLFPLWLEPAARLSLWLFLRLVVFTLAHRAQFHQVVVDVGAEDMMKRR